MHLVFMQLAPLSLIASRSSATYRLPYQRLQAESEGISRSVRGTSATYKTTRSACSTSPSCPPLPSFSARPKPGRPAEKRLIRCVGLFEHDVGIYEWQRGESVSFLSWLYLTCSRRRNSRTRKLLQLAQNLLPTVQRKPIKSSESSLPCRIHLNTAMYLPFPSQQLQSGQGSTRCSSLVECAGELPFLIRSIQPDDRATDCVGPRQDVALVGSYLLMALEAQSRLVNLRTFTSIFTVSVVHIFIIITAHCVVSLIASICLCSSLQINTIVVICTVSVQLHIQALAFSRC